MSNLSVDAGFIIGLYDPRDEHHERSKILFGDLFGERGQNVAIIVWPALYESISTRFVRDMRKAQTMERDWRMLRSRHRLEFVDDQPYRDDALEDCFAGAARSHSVYRQLSLTDRVLRAVLADPNMDIDGILTFNPADFSDVCRKAGKLLIC